MLCNTFHSSVQEWYGEDDPLAVDDPSQAVSEISFSWLQLTLYVCFRIPIVKLSALKMMSWTCLGGFG